jgi:adenylate cyclase
MATFRTFLRSPLVASGVISLCVFLGILGLRRSGTLEFLELATYDEYITMLPTTSVSSARIVLIAITERDIQHQGRWPISDAILAQVLQILTQYAPRAIGLDIYRDVEVPPGREELDAVLTANPHIITTMKSVSGKSHGVPPPPVLKDTEQFGFNDILVDTEGIVRRGLLFVDEGQTTLYSFALRLALLYLQAEGIGPQHDPTHRGYLRLQHTTIRPLAAHDGSYVEADAQGYQFLLDFRDGLAVFPNFSLTALLAGEVDPEAIKDKVVLIGVKAESVKDWFYTPHNRGRRAGQEMSGIDLHAHMIGQLLRFALDHSPPVRTASEGQEVGWLLLWSVMGCVIGFWVRGPWRLALWIGGGLLALRFVTYSAFESGWWIPVVPPALAWSISAVIVTAYMTNQEKRQRTLLMQLFARHVSPEVAETIWQQREQLLHQGRPQSQRMIASVLFSDVVGFTTVSEQMEPQALMAWLDEYIDAMTPHVMQYQGVVLRFIGDAILAVFGVPFARTTDEEIRRDAVHAVQCALAMEQELIALNQRWRERQLPLIRMRVGIFTGPLVAGSLGNAQRMEYNVHGDTVNTAARLESLQKDSFLSDAEHHPCRILIGEPTLVYLGDQFHTYRVGEVSLKGKEQRVTVHQVLGVKEMPMSESKEEEHR